MEINKKIQNEKSCALRIAEKRGISLLLVVIILSALLSISIGIFNAVFGQLKISGEIADSYIAFYAADQGIERVLYFDRIQQSICQVQGQNCYIENQTPVQSGGCYTLRVSKDATLTDIVIAGQYRCANSSRVVKRGFEVTY